MVTRMRDQELEEFRQFAGGKNNLAEQKANMAYLQEHYSQLLRDHPNHWVIIKGGGDQIILEEDPKKFEKLLAESGSTGAVAYFLAYPEAVMLL